MGSKGGLPPSSNFVMSPLAGDCLSAELLTAENVLDSARLAPM